MTYYLILILYGIVVILIPAIGFLGIIQKKNPTENIEKITIIVPFRNEEKGLKKLCSSVNKLNHPRDHFQVIFIDDDSSDNSLSILDILDKDIDFDIVQNPKHLGKKTSIIEGIKTARYDLILTTDADCVLTESILSGITNESKLSIGAVLKTTDKWEPIENIQEVESLMLAAITIGSSKIEIPMLATGANLAYKKDLFYEVDPYKDNLDLNSGDDMFLLKSTLQNGVKTSTRWNDPVITKCEASWTSYINQSARWASKNDRVGMPQTILAAWMVLLANILLPLSLFTHFSSGLIILLIKFVLDFLFLILSAVHFERFKAVLFAPVVFCFYPFHLIRVSIKIFSNKRKA